MPFSPPALRMAEPPPAWLPGRARALAPAETRQVQVELYGAPGAWLLRILQLPEDGDVPTWGERWFSFPDPVGRALAVPAGEVQVDPDRAVLRGEAQPLLGRWVLPAR